MESYQTLSPARRTFVFLGSRCTRPLTPRKAHALRGEFLEEFFRSILSPFSVENPHDGKTFENYTRFEWGVEVGVVTTFMLRLFVPHEFDMNC